MARRLLLLGRLLRASRNARQARLRRKVVLVAGVRTAATEATRGHGVRPRVCASLCVLSWVCFSTRARCARVCVRTCASMCCVQTHTRTHARTHVRTRARAHAHAGRASPRGCCGGESTYPSGVGHKLVVDLNLNVGPRHLRTSHRDGSEARGIGALPTAVPSSPPAARRAHTVVGYTGNTSGVGSGALEPADRWSCRPPPAGRTR